MVYPLEFPADCCTRVLTKRLVGAMVWRETGMRLSAVASDRRNGFTGKTICQAVLQHFPGFDFLSSIRVACARSSRKARLSGVYLLLFLFFFFPPFFLSTVLTNEQPKQKPTTLISQLHRRVTDGSLFVPDSTVQAFIDIVCSIDLTLTQLLRPDPPSLTHTPTHSPLSLAHSLARSLAHIQQKHPPPHPQTKQSKTEYKSVNPLAFVFFSKNNEKRREGAGKSGGWTDLAGAKKG